MLAQQNENKILFVIPSVDSGGIEKYLLRYFKQCESLENITILVRSYKKGDYYNQYLDLNVALYFRPLGYSSLKNIIFYFRFFKKNEFTTVCDFNANFAGFVMLIAKLAGIKKRITFYRQGRNHFSKSMFKGIYNFIVNRLVYYCSTNILSNSKAAIENFFPYRGKNDTRFKVVYNGIDSNAFDKNMRNSEFRKDLGIPDNAFVIGHIGRLNKAKNHLTILKVFKILCIMNKNFYLILCGNGTEKLKSITLDYGVESNVRLLGYRSDVPYVLSNFDLFFFPSITEGQPNSLIEAMLTELKVVASNIEPINEIFPPEYHVYLREPFDIDGFVSVINELGRSNELGYGQNLKKYATKRFSALDNFKLFHELLYNDCFGEKL